MRILSDASYAWAVLTTSWRAFKALQHQHEQAKEQERLLASLGLLAALWLWDACTPLAWAAAWLPGYHLLRSGLHLLIAAEGSQVGSVLLQTVAPRARALEQIVRVTLLPGALNAALALPQQCLAALFPEPDAMLPSPYRKQKRRRQSWSDSVRQQIARLSPLSPPPSQAKAKPFVAATAPAHSSPASSLFPRLPASAISPPSSMAEVRRQFQRLRHQHQQQLHQQLQQTPVAAGGAAGAGPSATSKRLTAFSSSPPPPP